MEGMPWTSGFITRHRPAPAGFARKGYRRLLEMLNANFKDNDYLLGENFTCADIVVGHTLTW